MTEENTPPLEEQKQTQYYVVYKNSSISLPFNNFISAYQRLKSDPDQFKFILRSGGLSSEDMLEASVYDKIRETIESSDDTTILNYKQVDNLTAEITFKLRDAGLINY